MTNEELDELCLYWWGSDTDLFSLTTALESGLMRAFAKEVIRVITASVLPEEHTQDSFEYCCDYSQSMERHLIRTRLLKIANQEDGVVS